MTHRFFVPQHQISRSTITIIGSDAHQLRNVLRLPAGSEIAVMDGTGRVYTAKITAIEKDKVLCEQISSISPKSLPKIEVTLLQSIPRESKMDLIIQKSTELGVSRIIPAISERTIIKLGDEKKEKRLLRWERIAKEAAEQSVRELIPKIDEVRNFGEAIKEAGDHDISLIPWEMEEETTIKDILKKNKKARTILIAIGPEGGFSKEEIDIAKKAGLKPVSLGKRILRTETAGIAVLAMINYEFEI